MIRARYNRYSNCAKNTGFIQQLLDARCPLFNRNLLYRAGNDGKWKMRNTSILVILSVPMIISVKSHIVPEKSPTILRTEIIFKRTHISLFKNISCWYIAYYPFSDCNYSFVFLSWDKIIRTTSNLVLIEKWKDKNISVKRRKWYVKCKTPLQSHNMGMYSDDLIKYKMVVEQSTQHYGSAHARACATEK